MPTKRKKIASRQAIQTKLPYTLSKRKTDESFQVPQTKRAKNYIEISDSDDDDEDSQIDAANSSFTTDGRDDDDGDESDTGSVIIVDSRPPALTAEVVARSVKLDELIKKVPTEVRFYA